MNFLPTHSTFYGHLAATAIGLMAIHFLLRKDASVWVRGLLALGCAALATATFLASDPHHMFSDFWQAYYLAGAAVLQGPEHLGPLMDRGVEGFVNLPILAYLLAPFALLPLPVATGVFNLIGLSLTGLAWLILVRLAKLDTRQRFMLALLFAANGPLLYSIRIANTTQAILCALAAGLLLVRAKKSVLAGALLGLAAIIKLPLLVFGAFFLLRRDLRGTAAFGGVLVTAFLLSLLVFGWSANLHWVDVSVLKYGREWLPAYNNQSIPGLLGRLHTGNAFLVDWRSAYIPPLGERLAVQAMTVLIFLVGGLACLRSPARASTPGEEETRRDLQYLLTLVLALLYSPVSWSHYYLLLLMPTAFFLGSRPVFSNGNGARALGWLAIFLVTPVIRYATFSDNGWLNGYGKTGLSTLLFGGFAWFVLVAWRLAQLNGLPERLGRTADLRVMSPTK